MSSPEGALEVRVKKRLGDFRLDVAFTAAAGVTAVFGPSGAGKSQTLAAIAGASRPDAGRVSLGAHVLFDKAARIDLPMQRRRIGWVFQDSGLFPHLSVEANLDYGAGRARGRQAGVHRGELVEMLALELLLKRRPSTLSGGERQRVAIGRALLSQPALLLMDEPLASLDHARRIEILPYLARLKSVYRLPIVYVTHALSEVVRLADRLVVLEAGRVSAQGPVAEVTSREDLPLLASRPDAGVVLDAVVSDHDPARGLTRLVVGRTDIFVPRLHLAAGEALRVVALARDVLLATTRPQALSARNVLPGTVEAVASQRTDGVILVRLRLSGGPTLLSAVTRDAVESLGLAPGLPVFAILKSVAVEGTDGAGLLQALES